MFQQKFGPVKTDPNKKIDFRPSTPEITPPPVFEQKTIEPPTVQKPAGQIDFRPASPTSPTISRVPRTIPVPEEEPSTLRRVWDWASTPYFGLKKEDPVTQAAREQFAEEHPIMGKFTGFAEGAFTPLNVAFMGLGGAGTVARLAGMTRSYKLAPAGEMTLSAVQPGDVLTTQRDSYAQINFSEGSAAAMRPNTAMKLEAYSFNKDAPQGDNMFMKLLKGGLRTVTGLIGKRGNQDSYKIGTSTATIGIRGSSGDTVECPLPDSCGLLAQGTFHTTYTGSYIMQNDGGTQIIGEGQFGFARDPQSPPVILPGDPGLNVSQLPFTLGVGSGRLQGPGQECVVR